MTRTYTGDTVSLTGSTASDGKAVTDTRYAYDQLGRLIQVTLVERNDTPLTTPEVTKYYFDAVGDLSVVAHSNGMTDHYTYDSQNRLTLLTHNNTANAVISSFGYTLNADGSRNLEEDYTGATKTAQFQWTYDGLGRLTKEEYTSTADSSATYTDTYTFDTVGNRTQKVHVVGSNTTTTSYTYDANDRLLQETFNAPGTSDDTTTVYSYNGTNNNFTMLTGKAVHAGLTTSGTTLSTTTYSYDDQDRLTQIVAGNVTTSFAYDPAGARISQTVVDSGTSTTTTIKYVTDTNNPTGYTQVLEERTTVGSTTTTKTYTLGLDVIAQSDTATSNGTLTFLYDGHGSTRAMVGIVSSALTLLQTYAYDAYGNRIGASNLTSLATAVLTSLLYSGEQIDGSGMQFLRARYYEPNVGRFISSDSFAGDNSDPLSLHRYLYCNSSPIGATDPSGLFEILQVLGGISIQAMIDSALLAAATVAGFKAIDLIVDELRKRSLLVHVQDRTLTRLAVAYNGGTLLTPSSPRMYFSPIFPDIQSIANNLLFQGGFGVLMRFTRGYDFYTQIGINNILANLSLTPAVVGPGLAKPSHRVDVIFSASTDSPLAAFFGGGIQVQFDAKPLGIGRVFIKSLVTVPGERVARGKYRVVSLP